MVHVIVRDKHITEKCAVRLGLEKKNRQCLFFFWQNEASNVRRL